MTSAMMSEHQAAWLVWLLNATEHAEATLTGHELRCLPVWGVRIGKHERASRSASASRSRALSNLERRGYLRRLSEATGGLETAKLCGFTTGRHVRATHLLLTEAGRELAVRLRNTGITGSGPVNTAKILLVNRLDEGSRAEDGADGPVNRATFPLVNGSVAR